MASRPVGDGTDYNGSVATIGVVVTRGGTLRGTLSKRVLRHVDGLLAAWPDRPDRFWSRCARITGWDSVLACASQHGVLEVLRPGLTDERSPLTAAQRSWIKRTRRIDQWLQQPILDALADVLRTLDEASIQAVALKGPVLSERLYGEPSARRFTDLDFLVMPENLDRAVEALRTLGYLHQAGPSERFFRAHHHHIHLYAVDKPVIELHFILSSNFGVSIPAAPFLERSSRFAGKQGSAWVLAPEDEWLYLAQHAAGHYFARAAWLHDLKMLLRRFPNLDGSVVCRRAADFGVARSLRFTRHVLDRRFGVRGPADETSCHGRHWLGDRLLALIEALPSDSPALKVAGLAYEGLLADEVGAVSQLIRRRLSSPRTAGWGEGWIRRLSLRGRAQSGLRENTSKS